MRFLGVVTRLGWMEYALTIYVSLSHVHAKASSTRTFTLFHDCTHVRTIQHNLKHHSVLACKVGTEP